ncbi:MAG TPA: nucleotidyltransferase [Stellaceae bacterium]|nr:nucleotidyltransferase [Stellaceae bacterium]
MGFDAPLSPPHLIAQKAQLVAVLERLCEALELTPTQFELAKQRHEAVGEWLAASPDPRLRTLSIYLQGSTALGTTVKPLGRNEHDVDLVGHIADGGGVPPAILKKLIGDRLRQNGHYRSLLEEMPRCWRLNYASEFHQDITPSVPNPLCSNGGELVPDKTLREWMPSNPKGYRRLFEQRAALQPRMRLAKGIGFRGDAATDIEPYPAAGGFKSTLRRAVQIGKRHRDVYFDTIDPGLAPISVILTTLLARSYEYCVTHFVYDNELDLLYDIVRHMPDSIESQVIQGRRLWFIWNETTNGENFAEKWNNDPRRAEAFFGWHQRALRDLEVLAAAEGLDQLSKGLRGAFGQAPANKAMDALINEMSDARRNGRLGVSPGVGLSIGSPRATGVRSNTFFGAP